MENSSNPSLTDDQRIVISGTDGQEKTQTSLPQAKQLVRTPSNTLDLAAKVGGPTDHTTNVTQMGFGPRTNDPRPLSGFAQLSRERPPTERISRTKPTIPGYEIESVLGVGATGTVYRARDLKLNRPVALKLLNDTHGDGEELQRFCSEAEVVAKLSHPNIVQIYEIGVTGETWFLSLELLEGGTLDRWMHQIPTPTWREAVSMMIRVAEGVAAAHDQSIVHRDLKPANILLTTQLSPKISDFGLAKLSDQDVNLTRYGMVVGTPAYMAPEQASGQVDRVGTQADVHALGAILYEMIVGRSPFRATSVVETLQSIVSNDATPPNQTGAHIPRDLETIILKCLEKMPGERYQNARELADDLRRFAENRPIAAQKVPLWVRWQKWAARNPVLTIAIATIALTLLTATGVSLTFGMRALAWAREADVQRQKALVAAEFARQQQEKAETAEAVAVVERNNGTRREKLLLYDRALNHTQASSNLVAANELIQALTLKGESDPYFDVAARRNLTQFLETMTCPLWATEGKRVTGCRFSGTGKYVAITDESGELTLYESSTGHRLQTYQIHEFGAGAVNFAPNDEILAVGDRIHDGKTLGPTKGTFLRIFRRSESDPIQPPIDLSIGERSHVGGVTFSPDSKAILGFVFDGKDKTQLFRYEYESGKMFRSEIMNLGRVVGFHPETEAGQLINLWVLSISEESDESRTTIRNFKPVTLLQGENTSSITTRIVYSDLVKTPSLKFCVVTHPKYEAWLVDPNNSTSVRKLTELGHVRGHQAFADGKALYSYRYDKQSMYITYFDRNDLHAFESPSVGDPVWALDASGRFVITIRGDRQAVLCRLTPNWDKTSSRQVEDPPRYQEGIFSPNRKRIAFIKGSSKQALVVDVESNLPISPRLRNAGHVLFLPNSNQILVTNREQHPAALFDLEKRRFLGQPISLPNFIWTYNFIPNSTDIILGSNGYLVRWNPMRSRTETYLNYPDAISGILFSANSHQMALSTYPDWTGKPVVAIVDTKNSYEPVAVHATSGGATMCAFGDRYIVYKDQQHLACVDWLDGSLRWKVPISGPSYQLIKIDEQTCATETELGVFSAYSIANGTLIKSIDFQQAIRIHHVAVAPNGKSIAVLLANNSVELLDWPSALRIGRPLTSPRPIVSTTFSVDSNFLLLAHDLGYVTKYRVPEPDARSLTEIQDSINKREKSIVDSASWYNPAYSASVADSSASPLPAYHHYTRTREDWDETILQQTLQSTNASIAEWILLDRLKNNPGGWKDAAQLGRLAARREDFIEADRYFDECHANSDSRVHSALLALYLEGIDSPNNPNVSIAAYFRKRLDKHFANEVPWLTKQLEEAEQGSDSAKTLSILEKLESADPDSPTWGANKVELLISLKNFDEADQVAQVVLGKTEQSDFSLACATHFAAAKRWDRAWFYSAQALTHDKTLPRSTRLIAATVAAIKCDDEKILQDAAQLLSDHAHDRTNGQIRDYESQNALVFCLAILPPEMVPVEVWQSLEPRFTAKHLADKRFLELLHHFPSAAAAALVHERLGNHEFARTALAAQPALRIEEFNALVIAIRAELLRDSGSERERADRSSELRKQRSKLLDQDTVDLSSFWYRELFQLLDHDSPPLPE